MDTADTIPLLHELCYFPIFMLSHTCRDEDDGDIITFEYSIRNKEDPSGVNGEPPSSNKNIEEEENEGEDNKSVFF